jgi:hypothetical protein
LPLNYLGGNKYSISPVPIAIPWFKKTCKKDACADFSTGGKLGNKYAYDLIKGHYSDKEVQVLII